MVKYQPSEIEAKWQKIWEEKKLYLAEDFSKKPKYYILVEFPYPSGERLHVGHARSYMAMDALSRKKRMEGFNVLYPIGWDAFGLPAENYAIKTGIHPSITTEENIKNAKKQAKSWGLSFDWTREINTTDPKYYKWTQWIFLKLLENDMAYQKDVAVNWCPTCKTNLADEEVLPDGTHERCGTQTERRMQKQWLLRITRYADKLLEGLKEVDYPDKVRIQQENWIGRSEGTEIQFPVEEDLNYVLLHGFKGSSKEDFFPWLFKELKEKGKKVFCPDLPNTFNPNIEEQVEFVMKNWDINEKTVVITHSLGGVIALKLLPKLKKPIKKLIMLAPPLRTEFLDGKKRKELSEATDWKFDFQKVKEKTRETVVLRDTHDHIVLPSHPEEIAKQLNARLVDVLPSSSHFNCPEAPGALEEVFYDVEVFTTRPDTIFGVTALVVAPEHPIINLIPKAYEKNVKEYIEKSKKKSEIERLSLDKEKTGEFTGLYAINPVNNEKIPVWVGDYVVGWYGKGAVMMVPAHDKRDFQFAKKYKLEIKEVITGGDIQKEAYEGEGKLINSGEFSGQDSQKARESIAKWLEEHNSGSSSVHYKLRDWVFSRQHYWGEPIPVVHCEKCGVVPVLEKDLPVNLPYLEKYQPSGTGKSPLERVDSWVNTTCPKCKGKAKRETDTMPNWAGSNWYFLRYLDPQNDKVFADEKKMKYWMPTDIYQGGFEHTTLHLLYSRFIYRFLSDIKQVPTKEPYAKRRAHGIVLGTDGRKMSKSFGNVINPDEIVGKFGADTLRIYEAFMGPFDQTIAWSEEGVEGCFRFLKRIYQLASEKIAKDTDKELLVSLHRTIQKVDSDLESFKFNTAIASMMEFINSWQTDNNGLDKEDLQKFLLILAPFAPHLSEEIWQSNFSTANKFTSIQQQQWPSFDLKLLEQEEISIAVLINGKVRDEISISHSDINNQKKAEEIAKQSSRVKQYLQGKSIKRVVYIEGKIINFVTD